MPYENALIVNQKIKNSTLVTVEGGDHLYSTSEYMGILFSSILEFYKK